MPVSIRRWLAVALWFVAFVQVATIQPSRTFALPTPWTWEHGLLAALFVITSAGFIMRPRRPWLIAAHVAVVTAVVALHPLTAFGRDGSAVVLMAWLVTALAALPIRREWVLTAASLCVAILAVESLLSLGRGPRVEDLPDYGDLFGEYGPCGFLKPGLDLMVRGEDTPARVVTDALGLRRDVEAGPRAGEPRRVLLVGDSFIAGYRTDQVDLLAVQLERRWRDEAIGPIEVMAAGAGHPGASVDVVRECGARVRPDVVVAGLTLGNDLAQIWFDSLGLTEEALEAVLLPVEASRTAVGLWPVRWRASLQAWRLFSRVDRAIATEVMRPWYEEGPRAVHVLDPGHSIGLFYTRGALDEVEVAYASLTRSLVTLADEAGRLGAALRVAVIPQRFQMTDREWRATLFAYGLDPAAFEWEAPQRRLADVCVRARVECADLLPALRDANRDAAVYQPGGDMHWNRRGQAAAADALLPAIRAALAEAGAR